MCVPSRISQWSARYPQETRVLLNEVYYCHGVLAEDLLTFPEVLAQAGYRTANIGKWHTPQHPTWQENEHIETGYVVFCLERGARSDHCEFAELEPAFLHWLERELHRTGLPVFE